MLLTISVVSAPQSSMQSSTTCSFESLPITIGRASSCDFVIPDGEKHVSSKHAELALNGNKLTVTDISTNGVFVNGKSTPLGRGNSATLDNGDTLQMGNFIVSVAFNQSSTNTERQQDPFSGFTGNANLSDRLEGPSNDSDPFASLDELIPPCSNSSESIDHLEDFGSETDHSAVKTDWNSDPFGSDEDSFGADRDPFADLEGSAPPMQLDEIESNVTIDNDDWAGWLDEIPAKSSGGR